MHIDPSRKEGGNQPIMFFEECHSTSIAPCINWSIYAAKNLASMFMASARCPAKIVRFCHRQDIKSRLTLLEPPVVWPCLDAVNISLTHTLSNFQCSGWKNLPSTMCLVKNVGKTWKEAPHPRYHQSHSPKMHPHCVDFIPIRPPYGDSPYSVCEKKGKGFDLPKEKVLTEIHEILPSASLEIMKIQKVSRNKSESLNIPLNSRFPRQVSVQSPFCPISWWGLEARPRWNLQRLQGLSQSTGIDVKELDFPWNWWEFMTTRGISNGISMGIYGN